MAQNGNQSQVMDTTVYIIAGPLFLISFAAHLYVKFRLRPRDHALGKGRKMTAVQEDSDLDDYYYEFEHCHPDFAKYTKWSKITFIAAAIGALLLFIAAVI